MKIIIFATCFYEYTIELANSLSKANEVCLMLPSNLLNDEHIVGCILYGEVYYIHLLSRCIICRGVLYTCSINIKALGIILMEYVWPWNGVRASNKAFLHVIRRAPQRRVRPA